jgi:RNA polymerase sigma-70 factor (ECF subfamily)
MSDPRPTRSSEAGFPTTHWSLVLRAGGPATPQAREALAGLCASYWYPVYAFIRRQGHKPDEAQDLTQAFIVRLLEKGGLPAVDPCRGRFRAYLRTACDHFLADQRDRAGALKRGGDRVILSVDARDAEGRYLREPAHDLTPERLFERAWALTLLDRVLERLGGEYQRAGQAAQFEQLKVILTAGSRSVPYATLAERLGTTEGTVQVAAHRLRRRYRALLLEEIAATLDDPAGVEEEVRELFEVLGA